MSSVSRGRVVKQRTVPDVVTDEEGVTVLLAVWLMMLEAGGVAVGLAGELLDDDSSGDMTYFTRASC